MAAHESDDSLSSFRTILDDDVATSFNKGDMLHIQSSSLLLAMRSEQLQHMLHCPGREGGRETMQVSHTMGKRELASTCLPEEQT